MKTKDLKAYLKMVSDMAGHKDFEYTSVHDFVLKEGKSYNVQDYLPSDMPRKPLGECFKNVFEIIMFDFKGQYTYVEGFAFRAVLPLAHAWLVDKDGKAWDPTWYDDTREGGLAYYGCEFPAWYVREMILKEETYISMIDNWMGGFPLLTGEHGYPVVKTNAGRIMSV